MLVYQRVMEKGLNTSFRMSGEDVGRGAAQ